ncbi:MAG: ABC transporter permease [Vallitaleaceae bacterium]|jgi:ABC-2 type transport system permease protein|nr:ABC transporter permease [Vallitaleaceae bacterium]
MLKKMFTIFRRDAKVNTREFLTAYIMLAPVIFAIAINLIAPGINDTTVNLALVKGDDEQMVAYLEDFAKVDVFKDVAALEKRVGRRDDVFAIVPDGDDYYVLQQGNEVEGLEQYATMMLTFYQEGMRIEDSTAIIHSFDRTVPPLKKLLVNIFMMFSAIMGGMLIAINIIEEKEDRTIRAINLTPISRTAYIFAKSVIGITLPLYGSVVLVVFTGFRGIDWGQMMVLIVVSTLISILVGFTEGLKNETVMDAAGSVKMLFLPMAGAVAVAEMVGEKWQWVAYWVPFYWTYKGVDSVLTYNANWGTTLLYALFVVIISIVAYLILMPGIRKGLE